MRSFSSGDFDLIYTDLLRNFVRYGETVTVGEWQSIRDQAMPHMVTHELLNVSFQWHHVPQTVDRLQEEVKPNLPWAEDHFIERVDGLPLNPGEQYQNWPWYQQGVENHLKGGVFSHTYMERYWPKFADREGRSPLPGEPARRGIRFEYGDLRDLTHLLLDRPDTRQAYLPIWFPEDLRSALSGHRVPCSLGYHFIRRGGQLHVTYTMRSCDWFRYFRDDVYLTCRLLQWVADQTDMQVGSLTMHITSLHIFEAEIGRLEEEHANRER